MSFAGRIVALGFIASFAACEEDVTVPPPPPDPQIPVSQTYSKGSTGLPNNDVFALLTLSNGEFWIGTEQGIARYASISATSRISGPNGIINELNGLPNPKVRDMAELDSKVYVATWGGGFAIYDVAGGTWTSRTPENSPGDDVQDVAVGATATSSGVVIVSPGPNGVLETYPRGDDQFAGNTIVAGDNRIAQTKAWRFNGSIADIEISTAEGKVYLATNDVIGIYDPALDRFSSFSVLTRDVVSAVEVRDTPGGIERWYGPRVDTIEGGPGLIDAGITVSRGTSTVFNYTQENSALPEPDVNAIYFDADSDLFWVAFSNQGLASVDADLSIWTTYTTAQGLPSNTVYSVARAASPEGGSTMWAATQNGVARMKSNGTWQGYNTSGGLSADRVRDVYSDDGSRLWVGYITGGAAKLNPASAQ